MACEINASPSNGLVQSADGSGIIKLKSDGKTTNALAWVNFNGTGTVAIRSSYNVSSITDNGTGNYTVNFATALSDANYSIVCTAADADGTGGTFVTIQNFATSILSTSARVNSYTNGGALADSPLFCVTIHGN